jgi:hypothetical protein
MALTFSKATPSKSTPIPFTLGYAHRNCIALEQLLPDHAHQWATEAAVIAILLEDDELRVAIVAHLEQHTPPNFKCWFIYHTQLVIPLWYKVGEGEEMFRERLSQRQWAGEILKTVRPYDFGKIKTVT